MNKVISAVGEAWKNKLIGIEKKDARLYYRDRKKNLLGNADRVHHMWSMA